MKKNLKLTVVLSAATVLLFTYGCSKNQVKPTTSTDDESISTLPRTHDGLHVYGLLPTPESEYSRVPMYDAATFDATHTIDATGAEATVVTLASPAVRNQGQIGSCTGFAGSEAYEITYNYTHGAFPAIVSPLFLYYEERVNILGEKITADDGADMVDIGEALEKYGISSEALYPYPANGSDAGKPYKTAPTAAAIKYALGYEATTATLLAQGDTATVKKLLRANTCVYFGFNVYDNTSTYQYFENLNTTSYTYNPLTSTGALEKGVTLLGGHANVIIGFSDAQKAFWVENSWDTTWGDKGYYWLPYSVFQSKTIVAAGNAYYMAVK
jgi:C1A family cysteine protease